MKKIFTIFSILLFISISFGLQTNQINSYSEEKEIKGVNTNFNSINYATENKLRIVQLNFSTSKYPEGNNGNSIDSNNNLVLVGTKIGGRSLVLFNSSSGDKVDKVDLGAWVDNVGMYEANNSTYIAGSSLNALKIKEVNSNNVFQRSNGGFSRSVPNKAYHLDNDSEKELIIGGSSRYNSPWLEVRELDGDLEFKTDRKNDLVAGIPFKDKILSYTRDSVSLLNQKGKSKWSKSIDSFHKPVILDGKAVWSRNGKLTFHNENGDIIQSFDTGRVQNILKLEKYGLIAGTRNSKLILADYNTGEKFEREFDSNIHDLEKTDFNQDGENELVVKKSHSIYVFNLEREKEKVTQNSVIYGSQPEKLLKSISNNLTVFTGLKSNSLPSKINKTVKASKADFSNLTEDKQKYFADSRVKQIYISALASKKNATITFNQDRADRDFSNYSVRQLQNLFIEKFKPNHIAVADLESEKGLLSAYMAVKKGVLPVDSDEDVVKLKTRIERTFDRIGENRNTIFDGKYISLLDAPAIDKSDPVEEGFFSDPEDGKGYKTDLEYGNLDSDRYLEAGVGRYPEDLEKSSLIFHRSINRALGDNATVASEYLSSNWPTILATGGGGLRYGSRMERVFKEENYDTTHLVEYRSEPVKFLTSLTPVEITSFLGEVDDIGDIVAEFVSETAANAVENTLILVKALNYTEQLMEMYFEFDWAGHEFSLDRGIDRLKDLDIDPESDGGVQKSVMKLLYAFVWPERHPKLNQSSLTDSMERSDILYYQGVGDQNSWKLPENKSYSQSFHPDDIPELNRTIIWDNSDLGANGEMRKSFIEQGASSYIGYSSVNYPAYSSLTAYNFFRHRKTLGNSLKASINQMKTTDNIYSVSAVYKTGLKQKMLESLRLYGNPEMRKDPVNSERFKVNRSCDQSICKLDVSIDTPLKIVQRKGSKTVSSNSSSYLLQPGAVITPVYSYTRELPEGAEIIDRNENLTVSEHEDLDMERFTPISAGGNTLNVSDRNYSISKTDLEVKDNSLTYTVAGLKNDSVVESAELKISYRTPVNVKAETENRSLKARIHSDNSFDGKILYEAGNITGTKSISIEEGENIFELENLSYGEYQTQIVVVDEEIVATSSEKVRIGKPLEIALFSPEIREASTREVTAVVSNPNSFKVKETVKIRTGNKTVPGMLEDTERSVNLGPEESNRLNWRILGTGKGSTTLRLGDETEKVQVRSSTDSEESISADSIIRTLSSPTSEISATVSDGALDLEWSASRGVLTVKRNSTTAVSRLETDGFEAFKRESSERSVIRVETKNGTYVRTSENGLIEKRKDLDKDIAQKKIEKLEREVEKVDKIFSQRLKAEY